MQKNRAVNFLKSAMVLLPLCLFFSLAFHLEGGKSLVSKSIPLAFITSMVFFRSEIIFNLRTKLRKPFLFCSIIAFLAFSLFHLVRDDPFSFSRTLLLSIIYLLIVPWRLIPKQWFLYIFAFAGIISGIDSLYAHYILNEPRVGLVVNPIPYALYCASLTLVSFYHLLNNNQSKLLKFLFALSFIYSLIALALTSTRGVIVILPIALICVFFLVKPVKPLNAVKMGLILALSAVMIYFPFKGQIDSRIERTIYEIQAVQNGNLQTSFGIRLTLWKHGVEIAKKHWLLGIGTPALVDFTHTNSEGYNMNHLHNQYVDTLARYGVVGLFFLLCWLGSALITKDDKQYRLRLSPVLTSLFLLFFLSGMSDVPLHHTHLIYLYTFIVGIYLFMDEKENDQASES